MLERMETRFWQLREEGVTEHDARRLVAGEFYDTLAIREGALMLGFWVLELLTALQRMDPPMDRGSAEAAKADIDLTVERKVRPIVVADDRSADDRGGRPDMSTFLDQGPSDLPPSPATLEEEVG
eukprot:gene47087-50824_t